MTDAVRPRDAASFLVRVLASVIDLRKQVDLRDRDESFCVLDKAVRET